MEGLGAGARKISSYDAARAALIQPSADPAGLPGARARSSRLNAWWDAPVKVAAIDADRGHVTGVLVGQGDRFTTVRVEGDNLPVRHVHFPRQGYDLYRA